MEHTKWMSLLISLILFVGSNLAFAREGGERKDPFAELREKRTQVDQPVEDSTSTIHDSSREQLLIQSGFDGSGGGCMVIKNPLQKPLVDFILEDPSDLSLSPPISIESPSSTLFEKAMGMELWKIQKTQLYQQTMAVLDRWRTDSPIFIGMLKGAITNMRIWYTPFQLKSPLLCPSPAQVGVSPSAEVVPLALFSHKFGVIFSIPRMQEAPKETQIGALIHEGLRFMQISMDAQYTEQQIAQMTKLAVFGTPKVIPKGENGTFDNYQMHGSGSDTSRLMNGIRARASLFERVCEDGKAFVDQVREIPNYQQHISEDQLATFSAPCDVTLPIMPKTREERMAGRSEISGMESVIAKVIREMRIQIWEQDRKYNTNEKKLVDALRSHRDKVYDYFRDFSFASLQILDAGMGAEMASLAIQLNNISENMGGVTFDMIRDYVDGGIDYDHLPVYRGSIFADIANYIGSSAVQANNNARTSQYVSWWQDFSSDFLFVGFSASGTNHSYEPSGGTHRWENNERSGR